MKILTIATIFLFSSLSLAGAQKLECFGNGHFLVIKIANSVSIQAGQNHAIETKNALLVGSKYQENSFQFRLGEGEIEQNRVEIRVGDNRDSKLTFAVTKVEHGDQIQLFSTSPEVYKEISGLLQLDKTGKRTYVSCRFN